MISVAINLSQLICMSMPFMAMIALINFFTKKLAHFGFKLFRRQCAQIADSPYMQRIQSNRALYGDIEERMNAFFGIRAPPLDLLLKEGVLKKKAQSGFIKRAWHTRWLTASTFGYVALLRA
jgi:hypothetical protein